MRRHRGRAAKKTEHPQEHPNDRIAANASRLSASRLNWSWRNTARRCSTARSASGTSRESEDYRFTSLKYIHCSHCASSNRTKRRRRRARSDELETNHPTSGEFSRRIANRTQKYLTQDSDRRRPAPRQSASHLAPYPTLSLSLHHHTVKPKQVHQPYHCRRRLSVRNADNILQLRGAWCRIWPRTRSERTRSELNG